MARQQKDSQQLSEDSDSAKTVGQHISDAAQEQIDRSIEDNPANNSGGR